MPVDEYFECPADKSILNAAHAADFLISYSCRAGQCGSCMGRVVSGNTTYPKGMPDAISANDVASGLVLFCSAHACSDLVIEIMKPEF